MRFPCECEDKSCRAHPGKPCRSMARHDGATLYRLDMDDATGTIFCGPCAEAAWDSGLYTDGSPDGLEEI